MLSLRVLSMFLFAWAFAGRLPAQTTASRPQAAPSQPPAGAHTISMTVRDGTPLQIALDKEVRSSFLSAP
jgi:hypothetical protein